MLLQVIRYTGLLACAGALPSACVTPRPMPTPLIPRAVLFGNPVKAGPVLSPDGKQLAYVAPLNGVMNIWVRTLGEGNDHAVTSDTQRGIYGFQWQYDNRHLLFGQDQDGDENWRLYQVDTATGERKTLVPWAGVRSGVLAQSRLHPNEALIEHNRRDSRYMDVFRVNLTTGAMTTDTLNPGDVSGWIVDNDLTVRGAMITLPDAGNEIRLRERAGEAFRPWQRWGPDDANGGIVSFLEDNQKVLLNSSVGVNTMRLLVVDLATSRAQPLAANPRVDVGAVLLEPTTRRPLAVQFFAVRREWVLLDQRLRADFDYLKTVHAGDVNITNQSLDNRRWIVQYVTDDGPQFYYLYDREARQATLLFADRPELERYTLAKMQPVAFTARDGMELNGYLTLPVGFSAMRGARPPLILEVHGGPWARDAWGYNPSTQWLANRGYAVLKINFRGSTGFGKNYLNAGDREWGAKMLDDLIDGKRWALAQGYGDAQRVGIMGGSYGGYATLAALAFTPGEFACGVSVVGPSNLITLLNTIPPYWETERAVFARRVGRLDEETFLKARSPLFSADRIRAALLIAQGANDPRVKQAESDQIVRAIRARGGEVEYLLFGNEGHGFMRPENRIKYYETAEQFLAKHLGGRVEPPVPGLTTKSNGQFK
jgi:dipeptidyl aminopeptidase/acylaminoacyl peptidase